MAETPKQTTRRVLKFWREHASWSQAKQRCYNPKDKSYKRYGGRGISMCERWRNDFQEFIRDMGPCPDGYLLERVDNDAGYQQGNCVWATAKTQQNNRSNHAIIEWNGIRKNVAQWSSETGISRACIYQRLYRGWPAWLMLTMPSSRGNKWRREFIRRQYALMALAPKCPYPSP